MIIKKIIIKKRAERANRKKRFTTKALKNTRKNKIKDKSLKNYFFYKLLGVPPCSECLSGKKKLK